MATGKFSSVKKAVSAAEVGENIKSSKVIAKQTRENPELTIAIANAAERVTTEERLSEDVLNKIIESDSELKLAAKNKAFRKDLVEILGKFQGVGSGGSRPSTPDKNTPSAQPSSDDELTDKFGFNRTDFTINEKVSSETYQRLLLALADIPYARSGDIITSEHHNSLRAVVRLLAALINDASEQFVLSFAPNFLPIALPKPPREVEIRSGSWEVRFNRAAIPAEANGKVFGAFIVQLPEAARILGMIVRGKRVGERRENPKEFVVSLSAIPLKNDELEPKPLINFDLASEKDEFTAKASPKSSELRVKNETLLYAVIAAWEGSENTARFEINSIQIFCER